MRAVQPAARTKKPNQPFSIHVPDSVWLVESGKLDLFLVRSENGELAGARHHFVRVDEGRAVFGMASGGRDGTVIVATATPGTRLLCVSRDDLSKLGQSLASEKVSDPLRLLEDWVETLGSAAASTAISPKYFTELEADSILEVTDPPKPIVPARGILWVEHLRGASRFLGSDQIAPADGRRYFPVSRYGWLQPDAGSRILSIDSRLWQRSMRWRSLETFHQVILERLVLNRQLAENKNRKRLLNQAESDAVIVRGALRSLASPLEEEESRRPVDDEGLADPLLQACRALGKSLGVIVVSPRETPFGATIRDVVASIASASSLRHRTVVLKGKWWRNANGPLLAFRDADKRPVALLPSSNGGFQLYDPVEDRTVPVDSATAFTLNGFAYTFYRPLPSGQLSIWDLLSFGMRDSKRELLTIVFMGICAGLLGMVFPIATGIIFNSIIPSAQRSQLLQISVFLVIATCAASMFTLTRNFAMLRLEGKMDPRCKPQSGTACCACRFLSFGATHRET